MRPLTQIIALTLVLAGNLALAQPEQLTTTGGSYPTVSPDGNWVAYSSGGIMKIPAAGGIPVSVTSSGYHPDWSPSGDLIVYDDGGGALFVVDAMTGDSTLLADNDYFDRPAWSPDGTEIACTGDPSVKIVTYPGGDVSVPPCSGECHGEDPDWSSDGTTFCFEDGLLILTLPREGGMATPLVDCGNDVAHPAWSPDGRFVAFTRNAPNSQDGHIWVVDVATQALGQVTFGPFADYQPAWSPDMQWIYFQSNRSGSGQVWRVPFSEDVPVETISWGWVKTLWR